MNHKSLTWNVKNYQREEEKQKGEDINPAKVTLRGGRGCAYYYVKGEHNNKKNGREVGEWMKGEIPWGRTEIRRLKKYKRVCKEVGWRKLRIKDMKCKTEKKKKAGMAEV